MTDLHKSKPLIWGLLIAFCLVWFYTLEVRTLVPTDEGRYAEMAREMVTTNDWITPRLNGIKYFEKPPLQTWMTALAFRAFGIGEWQARLWTGLCGLFGIMLVAHTGRRLFNPRVGFIAALVLGSSLLWAALGHINTLDMGVASMMSLALCGLLLGQRDDATPREQRNWMYLCWLGMALAVLSKGLIGIVLPGAVLVLYTLISRDWAIWKRLHLGVGLLIFFAVTVPWFVLVSLKNPEFPQFFFIHEHFQRFTSKIHHRAGPWYYYIPILILGCMPWLGVLPQSLWSARNEIVGKFQPNKMLLIWTIFIFAFFSIANSKLPSYVLPIFPAIALMIARYLDKASHRGITWAASILALAGGGGLMFVWRISKLTTDAFEIPIYQGYQPWITAAAACILIGGVLAIILARRSADAALIAIAASGFLGGQLVLIGHEPLGRYAAGTLHLPAIQAELTAQMPLYVVDRYEHALPFYLGRTMTMVQHPDEMEFGLEQEPQLWIPTIDLFIQKWKADHASGKKSMAIMNPATYVNLQRANVPMRRIAGDPRRVIVTNDPK